MAAKAFLEQYMECTDSLPLDIQRVVSQYWELDYTIKDLLAEAQSIRTNGNQLIGGRGHVKDRFQWLIQLQSVMLSLREVSSQKLELTSQMLDVVEGYAQQLELAEKEVDNCRTRDEFAGSSSTRNSFSNVYKNTSSIPIPGEFYEKKKNERHMKRSRGVANQDQAEDELPSTPPISETSTKDVPVAAVTPSPSTSSTTKPPKKKVKIKKRATSGNVINTSSTATGTGNKDPAPLLPAGVVIPQPDFNSEPIDPDEPTYCLCNQVSFGEMIGCDNEECAIEWFHFVCVGLSSKPKGKWYCPQCVKERAKHRTSKS